MSEIRHIFLRRPNRRSAALRLNEDGVLEILSPSLMSETAQSELLAKYRVWIERALARYSGKKRITLDESTPSLRAKSQILVRQKIDHYNQFYGLAFRSIQIRKSQTRWGSCSSRRNLSFNYKIAALPDHLADYIVVHELCHLQEMNHSGRFWRLVEQQIPDHLERRRELKSLLIS